MRLPAGLVEGRAFLVFPGDDARKRERALASGADAVVMDLEDGVPADRKGAARAALATYAAAEEGPARLVRVNDPLTELGSEDLSALAALPAGLVVVVPKAGPAALDRAAEIGRPLVALVEDGCGLRDAFALAAHPAVAALGLGSADLRAALGLVSDDAGTELLYARSLLVVASAAAGIRAPLDGPCLAVRDHTLLERETRTARGLGLGGKLCIHPDQVVTVQRSFAPSADEIGQARRIVAEWERMIAGGRAVGLVDGVLVDRPVALRARAVVESAEGSGER
jgi:citrate lyase subunit beta/citryl-CoA lyase